MPNEIERIAGGVPEDPNAPLGDYGAGTHEGDPTFAEIINSEQDLKAAIQERLDDVNQAAVRNPDDPRAAGWASVEAVRELIQDPFSVTYVDLEDNEIGYALISGRGNKGVRVDFSAEETLSDWINYTLPEAVPSQVFTREDY